MQALNVFTARDLRNNIGSLALKLYEQKLTTLSLSAKIADVSIYDFLDMLKQQTSPLWITHPMI